MYILDTRLTYNDPIFDAHTHVVEDEALPLFVKISESYGVVKTVLIVHGSSIKWISDRYPEKFIFAKYFSGWILFSESIDNVIPDIERLQNQGYGVAKVHFAPFWIDRLAGKDSVPPVSTEIYDPFFEALSDYNIPTIMHIGDPDTYFETRYSDVESYGTKEEHIQALEERLQKSPRLKLQVAHFAAQPEPHRLDNLDRMLSKYENLKLDISSARWMSRELSKSPDRARDLIIKHQDRILFATDCVARSLEPNYYDGRFLALRLLLESNVRDCPLPFLDSDTEHSGGTYINGLNLPDSVLSKLYMENTMKFHEL